MSAIPIRFQRGDTLLICDIDGHERLWGVKERKMSGYLLQCHGEGDARTWSDEEILTVYAARRLKYFACNKLGIAENHAAMLDATWEMWPEILRREAERRFAYVKYVDDNKHKFTTLAEAYESAAATIFEANKDEWRRTEREEAIKLAATERIKIRINPLDPDQESFDRIRINNKVKKPASSTIRSWYVMWNENGRDMRLLIPRWHEGGRKEPRERRSSNGAVDSYSIMDDVIRTLYLTTPRKTKVFAHTSYTNACETHGIKAFSYRTFRLRILKLADDKVEFEKRHGRRAAYIKFGVFERRKPPERALEEVEVDHCLIDIIVKDLRTGRVLGRPWLTVIIDRASRVILGVHLSFSFPSYASLQRCLAHALWPKDLTSIDGLMHDWPCFGVPEILFMDNGKEFRSKSLQLSAAMLDFTAIPLPVKQPWLKGIIERLFGRIGVQVFSFEEGCTLSKTKDFYNPITRSELTLPELREKLLRWIVNEYHHDRHATLKCTPMERFRQLTSLYPVRPVPDFDHVIRLTGQLFFRHISNIGIEIDGLIYLDENEEGKRQLETLRSRRGGLEKLWTIRIDPFDIGEIHLLDDENGRWITVPCTEQAISRNVSLHQHKVHREIAQKNLPKGDIVTSVHIEQAMLIAENDVQEIFANGAATTTATRAARYMTNGEFFTPLGNTTTQPTTSKEVHPILEPANDRSHADDQRLAKAEEADSNIDARCPERVAPSPTPDLADDIEELVKQWNR